MSFWVCADKTPCGDAANTSATRATAQQLMAPGADQLKELVSPIKLFFGPRISHVLRIGRKRGTRAPPRANQKLDTGSLSRTGPYNRPGKSSSRPLGFASNARWPALALGALGFSFFGAGLPLWCARGVPFWPSGCTWMARRPRRPPNAALRWSLPPAWRGE